MFERYTDRARRVAVLANEEARRYGSQTVAPHDFLAALTTVTSLALTALEDCGVTYAVAGSVIDRVFGEPNTTSPGHILFTPDTRKLLKAALREALRLDVQFVGPEHILLGLLIVIEDRNTVANEILAEVGASIDGIRNRLAALMAPEVAAAVVVDAAAIQPIIDWYTEANAYLELHAPDLAAGDVARQQFERLSLLAKPDES